MDFGFSAAIKTLLGAIAVLFVLFIGSLVFAFTRGSSSSSDCYTFTRPAQPGLMQTFQGKVCPSAAGVQQIAKNYNQCVAANSVPQCGYALLQYFASSGAYPDDAAKATLLVIDAASQ